MADVPRPTHAQADELRAAAGLDPFLTWRPDPAVRADCVSLGWIAPDGTLTTTGRKAMRTYAENYGTSPTATTPSFDWPAWWAGQ